MPARWQISHWPKCEFHVFLSHCAEDREHFVIPLQVLVRSIWQSVCEKGKFYVGKNVATQKAIRWTASQIEDFVRQEELRGEQIAEIVKHDPMLTAQFGHDPNLLRRIAASDPNPSFEGSKP